MGITRLFDGPGNSEAGQAHPAPGAQVAGDHAFRAVPVPTGHHVVTLTLRTPGASTGVLITRLRLLYAIGLLAELLRRRRAGIVHSNAGDPAGGATRP